jgi:O-antigen ligase
MSKRPASPLSTRLFEWLFILLFVAVPFVWSSEFVFVAYYPKLLAFHIGLATLYIAWLLKDRPIFRSSVILLPVLAYLIITAFSAFGAVNRIDALVQISHRLGLALLFVVLLNNIRPQDFLRYMRPIITIGVVVALIGIAQYAGWGSFWKIPSTGLPSATLGYRNYAAMFTILCIPIALLLFLEARRPKSQWGWAMGCAILITFMICTRTRGAWVGLTLALCAGMMALLVIRTHDGQRLWQSLLAACTKDHITPAIFSLLATFLFLTIVSPNMQGMGFDRNRPDKAHLATNVASMLDGEKDTQKSVQHRLNMWSNTLEMIKASPILGAGAGNWHIAYPLYDGGDIIWKKQAPRRPHNDFVWIIAELGLVGSFLYLWLLSAVFLVIWRLLKTQNRARVRHPLFIGMSLIAILGHALFSFPRERIAVTLLFWTLIAFIAIFDADNRPTLRHPLWPMTRWVALITLIFCVGIGIRA